MKRFKSVNIASILGIIGNLFLLIIKGIVGVVTHSQAMIAEKTTTIMIQKISPIFAVNPLISKEI